MITSYETTIWAEVNGTSGGAKLTLVDTQPQQLIVTINDQVAKVSRAELAEALAAFDAQITIPQALKVEEVIEEAEVA
jgi:hypothetical protein